MPIPELRADGYLPEGVHLATLEEVAARFGLASLRRQALMARLRHWVDLGKSVKARRIVIDGSFVTSKIDPGDVDAVIQVTQDFHDMNFSGLDAAVSLYELIEGKDSELFSADSEVAWGNWIAFFAKTRDGITRGLVEVML